MDTFVKSLAWSTAAVVLCLGTYGAWAQQHPNGSYAKTCTNVAVNGTTLTATCKTFDQKSAQTSLPFYASCVGDIGNINGTLACAGPNGSFAQTCDRIVVEGNTLKAHCRKINGQWDDTQLNGFQGFQGDISNCDGQLRNGNC